MRNKKLMFYLFIVFFIHSSFVTIDDENGLLWRITGNGLEKPSFLFGTIHLPVKPAFLDSVKNIKECFNSSECILMEVDSIDISALRKRAEKVKRILPDTISYADLLNDADLHFLDSVLQKDLNIRNLNTRLHPYFLHRRIIQVSLEKQDSVAKNDSSIMDFHGSTLLMDFYMRKTAKERRKKTMGLDDMEKEFSIKVSTPLPKAARQMVNTLKYENELLMKLDTLVNYYISQDLICVSEYMTNSFYHAENLEYEDMPDDTKRRNIAWMDKILPAINNYSCFIAVGAGHLLYEYGLINLLRKRGYTVKPVK